MFPFDDVIMIEFDPVYQGMPAEYTTQAACSGELDLRYHIPAVAPA